MELLTEFDPNPQWYFYTLHTVSVLSTVVFAIGIVTVLAVRKTSINSSYRRLLLLNMTINYIMAMNVSFGIMPIFPLPLTGGYGVGVLANFHVSSVTMATSAVALGTGFSGSTALLFLYRHNSLLETSRKFTLCFYALLAVICISPIMSFVIACALTDQKRIKVIEATKHTELVTVIPGYWSDRVLLASLNLPGFSIFAVDLCASIIVAGSLMAMLVYRMTFSLRKNIQSNSASKKHQSLVYTLIIQTATNYAIFLTPCILMMVCFYSDIPLPGLTNICAIVVSLSDPFSVTALLLCHSDYRKFLARSSRSLLRRLLFKMGFRPTVQVKPVKS